MTLTAISGQGRATRASTWWTAALLGSAAMLTHAQSGVLPGARGGGIVLTPQSHVYATDDEERDEASQSKSANRILADFDLPDDVRDVKLIRLDVSVALDRLAVADAERQSWLVELSDTCDSRWRKIGEERAGRSTLSVAGSLHCYVGAGNTVRARLRTDRPMRVAALEGADLKMTVFPDLRTATVGQSTSTAGSPTPVERHNEGVPTAEPASRVDEPDLAGQKEIAEIEPPAPDETTNEASSTEGLGDGNDVTTGSSQPSTSVENTTILDFDDSELDDSDADELGLSSDVGSSSNDDPIYGVVTDLDAMDSLDPDTDVTDSNDADVDLGADVEDGDANADDPADETDPDPTRGETLAAVSRWALFVGNADTTAFELDIQKLVDGTNDLIVIDESNTEMDATVVPVLSRAVPRLQQATVPKLVLAFAEVANPNSGLPTAPALLYLVRDDWDEIWLGTSGLVRQLVAAGFDGVYLMGLDRSVAELARSDDDDVAADPEGELVSRLTELARISRASDGEFLIVVQNANALIASEDLSGIVDAVAEDQDWFTGFSTN